MSDSKSHFLNPLFKQIDNLDLIIKIIMHFNLVNKILNLINNRIMTMKDRFNFIIFNNNPFLVNLTISIFIRIKFNNQINTFNNQIRFIKNYQHQNNYCKSSKNKIRQIRQIEFRIKIFVIKTISKDKQIKIKDFLINNVNKTRFIKLINSISKIKLTISNLLLKMRIRFPKKIKNRIIIMLTKNLIIINFILKMKTSIILSKSILK